MSEHDRGEPMRAVSTVVTLPEASKDSLALIKAMTQGVAKMWRKQGAIPWHYSKAGVISTDLVPLADNPRALIGRLDRKRSGPLMAALDVCNARWGEAAVVPVRAGIATKREWNTQFEVRTPCYTTQVSDLPVAFT